MIRSSSEFCSDEKLSLKIRWWKTYTNFFSALMRLYFTFKGKSLIKCSSFEITREHQTNLFFSLFWINWFWNIFVYTVVKVFTSIYLKYWKEHLNIFYLFFISSALKNNAVRSFFMFLCVLFMVYNFWQRTHVFTVLMYFNTYEQMRYTRGKNPPISQKSSIYILFIAHTRLSILVSTFIEFFPFILKLDERKIIVSHLILSPAGTKFIKILKAIVIIFHLQKAF